LAVSPSDDTIVFGGEDGFVGIFNPRSGDTSELRQCEGPVWSLAFSPNGVLVAAASGAQIEIIDLQSGEVMSPGQIGKQPSLVFSPGGKSLAAASTDSPCEIRVWNLQT